ncbi:MAG: type VI secretion system tube protein Hcp, partial [Myxococcales bacterium]|nr:type VI secretion system tube protein Hcp [Myxococcales bacterium]
GTTEHFFTLEVSEARLASYRLLSPDASDRDNNDPPMEEVGFVFHNIRWCDEANHKEHADSWKEGGVR